MKPAFDDLEDIGFDLDSDRPIEFNNNNKKKQDDVQVMNNNKVTDLFGAPKTT